MIGWLNFMRHGVQLVKILPQHTKELFLTRLNFWFILYVSYTVALYGIRIKPNSEYVTNSNFKWKLWKELSQYSSELNVQMADCDITNAHALSGRFLITALPTIFHCTGKVILKFDRVNWCNNLKILKWPNSKMVFVENTPENVT